MFHDCNGSVVPIVNEARDVIFGHLGKLLLEETLQPCEDNHAFWSTIVVDNLEFDLAVSLFQNRRLWLIRGYSRIMCVDIPCLGMEFVRG